MGNVVVGITGASGAIYGLRLLQVLLTAGRDVHVTLSPAAVQVLDHELGIKVSLDNFSESDLLPAREQWAPQSPLNQLGVASLAPHGSSIFSDTLTSTGQLHYHHFRDYNAGIASGSFKTEGMAICPCSMGTLASLATGVSGNLIQRAADVHLKERRKLVVVPRETPLSSIALGNMKTLCDAGAVILPAMPGFYRRPQSVQDLVDFVVARVCDQLGVPQQLVVPWGQPRD